MLNVTRTYLPDLKRYQSYVDRIYKSGWVTNNGPLVGELESKLAEYLGVPELVLVANGTAALEIAYRTLEIDKFAVTTPFTFVATTSSLVTNGINPIFNDIDPRSLNLDPKLLKQNVSPNTSAIVPVHVFGNACDVDSIELVAGEMGVKVIYDCAHAFGVRYKDESILKRGDISTMSFHATKLFHTIEGGALVINDPSLVERARYLINFGIENEESIPHLGTNAKMNEFEAAMGLCVLEEIESILDQRATAYSRYLSGLSDFVTLQAKNPDGSSNFSYFPIILESEAVLKRVEASLKANGINPRRYFYPSLDTLSYIEPRQICEISRGISSRILCLPLYPGISSQGQDKVIKIILKSLF